MGGFGTLAAFGMSIFIFQQQIQAQNNEPLIEATDPQKELLREQGLGKGKWTMLDCANGKEVHSTAFLGKYLMVYVGFTLCPDVCPVELRKISNALHILEERGYKIGQDIEPIFVSCDPKRDTQQAVKEFVDSYHPKIKGLYGTMDQTEKIAKCFKAYFQRPPPGKGKNDDYYVDHSSITYVMDTSSEYIGHTSTLDDAETMAERIAAMIKETGGPSHSKGFFSKWFK